MEEESHPEEAECEEDGSVDDGEAEEACSPLFPGEGRSHEGSVVILCPRH